MTEMSTAQPAWAGAGLFRSGMLGHVLPFLVLLVIGLALPLFAGGYWGVIAQRACVYWVLVAGVNLFVGFVGPLVVRGGGVVTLGAPSNSGVAPGNVMPEGVPSLSLPVFR